MPLNGCTVCLKLSRLRMHSIHHDSSGNKAVKTRTAKQRMKQAGHSESCSGLRVVFHLGYIALCRGAVLRGLDVETTAFISAETIGYRRVEEPFLTAERPKIPETSHSVSLRLTFKSPATKKKQVPLCS